jgi:xylan 1,4-beta-xylosidase
MVARAAKKVYDQVHASAAPGTPIIWSEYNATYMNQQEVTDSAFMGPWLANHIRESDGLATMMSYWCFSDVFEEQGVVKTPFYGGYGLIAERGIPKAAFRAFELLHKLGDIRLAVDSENALVTKRADRVVIALWNYAEPSENGTPKTFKLDIKGAKKYRMQMVAPGSGSSLEAWKKMGSPVSPTPEQIKALVGASALEPAKTEPINHSIVLEPQALAVLEVIR